MVVVGRLKPGVSRSQAESAVSLLFFNDLIHGEKPLSKAEDAPAIKLLPAQTGLTGSRAELSKPLYVLMLAVGIVPDCVRQRSGADALRGPPRGKKENGGAPSNRREPWPDRSPTAHGSLTISVAGGLLGIAMAFWGARALFAFLTSTDSRPTGFSAEIDLRVLAFTAAASILTGDFVWPDAGVALDASGPDAGLKRKAGKSSSSGDSGRSWLNAGNALVVAQVALTVVVLVGAGLLVHTLQNLRNVDPGFNTNNVLNFSVDSTLTGYKGSGSASFSRELRDRFSEIPGVFVSRLYRHPNVAGVGCQPLASICTENPMKRIRTPIRCLSAPGFFRR